MTRLRHRLQRVRRAVTRSALAPPRAVGRWVRDWDPIEQVLYPGLVLMAVGLAFVYPPASAIAPGSILVYAALRRAPRQERE